MRTAPIVFLALLLPALSWPSGLRVVERRWHVDWSKQGELSEEVGEEDAPAVSRIVRSWVRKDDEPVFRTTEMAVPGQAAENAERSEQVVLIASRGLEYRISEATEVEEGIVAVEVDIRWSADRSTKLSAEFAEDPEGAETLADRREVIRKEGERAPPDNPRDQPTSWVTVTLGGRVWEMPDTDWTEGLLLENEDELLRQTVDDDLRSALEHLDEMMMKGQVPYLVYTATLLVAPLTRSDERPRHDPRKYVDFEHFRVWLKSTSDCSFDAGFGEPCSDEVLASEAARIESASELVP